MVPSICRFVLFWILRHSIALLSLTLPDMNRTTTTTTFRPPILTSNSSPSHWPP